MRISRRRLEVVGVAGVCVLCPGEAGHWVFGYADGGCGLAPREPTERRMLRREERELELRFRGHWCSHGWSEGNTREAAREQPEKPRGPV